MPGICHIKTSYLSFLLLAAVLNPASAGPPPGAPGFTAPSSGAAATPSFFSGLFFETGVYSPSLKDFNYELKRVSMKPFEAGRYYAAGIPLRERSSSTYSILIAGSYWKAISKDTFSSDRKYTLRIFSLYFPVIFERPVVDKILYLGAGFSTRCSLKFLKYEPDSINYYSASEAEWSLGPAFSLEYMPFPEAAPFSFSLYAENIMLRWRFEKLSVDSSNIAGYSPGDKFVTSDGDELGIDTSGLFFGVGLNLYY